MQRDSELAGFCERMYEVFNTGDSRGIDDLFSHDEGSVGIGTDPQEWFTGEAAVEVFKAQVPEMQAAGMRFEPGKALAYREGSVGWIADRPTLKTQVGGDVPLRLTGVCRQEDGAWKIVQIHLSIGVANEESIGTELTT